MKFTRSYCKILLEVAATLSVAFPAFAQVPQNNLVIGPKTNVNKAVKFNRNSSTPPQIRWNEGASSLQYSNDGTNFASFVSSNTIDMSTAIVNVGLAATVSSNALTIALKDKTGVDPNGSSQCLVSFRDPTSTVGNYTQTSQGSASSLVISSGSTLGTSNATSAYIFVYALKNGSAIDIGASLTKFDEGSTQTTVAEGGAGGADSITTLYSNTVLSNVPVRLIGRLLVNETVAGTWASAPTEISLQPFKTSRSQSAYITTSSTLVVPSGVTFMSFLGCGGGGGGAGASAPAAGGGGAGSTPFLLKALTTPGSSLSITIGAGGTAGAGGGNGGAGGRTIITGTGVDMTFPGASGGVGTVGGTTLGQTFAGTISAGVGGNGGGGTNQAGLASGKSIYVSTSSTGGTSGNSPLLGGGGGGGGPGFGVGANGRNGANTGTPAAAPSATNNCAGGGGGGADSVGHSGAGGAGAVGAVLITWEEK